MLKRVCAVLLLAGCATVARTDVLDISVGILETYESAGTATPVKLITDGKKGEAWVFVLTARHVIVNRVTGGWRRLKRIRFYRFGESVVEATGLSVVAENEQLDLMLVKGRVPVGTVLSALVLSKVSPRSLQEVYSFGSHRGTIPSVQEGIVSQKFNDKGFWLSSSHCSPGCSGGPVIDRYTSEVLGISLGVLADPYTREIMPYVHVFVEAPVVLRWLTGGGYL